MHGGGYSNFLKQIKKEAQTNYFAKFIIVDADRISTIPELLEMVDNKQLSLVNGVDIAAFDKEVQSYLLTYIKGKGSIVPAQLAALKNKETRQVFKAAG